jgi:protein arginine kinase
MTLPLELYSEHLWPDGAIWLGSLLTLQRNLSDLKFPPKLSLEEMITVRSSMAEVLQKQIPSTSLPAEDVAPLDKEYLFEHFLCQESFQQAQKGQGFLVSPKEKLLALINWKNHLQLNLLDTSTDLLGAWQRLLKLDQEIEKKYSFAFSSQFGFLTSDPTKCGTALSITTYLHLPGLIHTQKLHPLLAEYKDIDICSLEGAQEWVGDFVLCKNRYTLGLSEEEILHSLLLASTKLASEEKKARAEMKESAPMKDLIGRAFGLLRSAYQLETKETLNALSLLQLGTDLGLISVPLAPTLFFQCPRAHLAHLLQEKNLDLLPRRRAEWIQGALQK